MTANHLQLPPLWGRSPTSEASRRVGVVLTTNVPPTRRTSSLRDDIRRPPPQGGRCKTSFRRRHCFPDRSVAVSPELGGTHRTNRTPNFFLIPKATAGLVRSPSPRPSLARGPRPVQH